MMRSSYRVFLQVFLLMFCNPGLVFRKCVANAASTKVRLSSKTKPTVPFLIRRAKKEDIFSIDQCNRNNLPENYSHFFYNNHLEKWPELSLIAETQREGKESPETIGYCLGRIQVDEGDDGFQPSFIGHIASLAINKKFRGLGVAQQLMKKLHREFADSYNVDSVSLYCRLSNEAAFHLYSDALSYTCKEIVSEYYEDREDAYSMTLSNLKERNMKEAMAESSIDLDLGIDNDSDSIDDSSSSSMTSTSALR